MLPTTGQQNTLLKGLPPKLLIKNDYPYLIVTSGSRDLFARDFTVGEKYCYIR